jgi:hypothetical protein
MDDDREERRQAPRHRVLKGGRIVFNDGRSVIDCQVRNQSEGGARLKLATVVGVPDEFELRIAADVPRRCRVIWRTGQEIGVAFS